MRISRVVRFGLPLLFATVAALVPSRAQEPASPADQRPTFKSGVDSVTVDVTVTDKQGRPVTDLKADDFEIREGGKVQAIDTFKLIKTDDGLDDPSAAREILSTSDQDREVARDENRLFVVFLDDYHVRRGNGMVVREQVAKFLRNLSRHDLVAIATPLSTVAGLTFSRNPDVTAANVMGFVGRKYEYTPMNALEQRYQDLPPEQIEQMRNNIVISALSNVCQFLGSMRDGRKSILYVSEGMSGSMPVGVRTTGSFTPNVGGARSASQTFFDNSSLLLDMQSKVFREATRNNVAIYTLDPRGLTNFEFDVGENVTAQDDRRIVQESVDLLRVVAEQTDGRAIVNRNDPIPALQQMVRDSSAYYLLSYTSTLAPRDGKFHEIQVRLKRRDVEVRARKGYWAYSPEELAAATATPKAGPPADVSGALDDLASATGGSGRGRAVSVWLGAERGPTEKARVTLAWEVPGPAAADPMDAVDHITIVASAVTGDEIFRGPVARDPQAARTGGLVAFDAPAGEVRVRISAENARGNRLDTSDASITVPDFTTPGPVVTTPFLYRGRTARDLQQVRAATSPTPVVAPVFSRSERLLIRFSAYGPAGTTPVVTVRWLNQAGSQIAMLPAPTNAGGNLFESELGLGSFPPGDYLVEIVAQSGEQTTKRLLAVRVTG
ncbi:MAG: VWA domain-containing protein [Acidobacteriota bacterium]